MSKFKVGDKVKITNNGHYLSNHSATITEVDNEDTFLPYHCNVIYDARIVPIWCKEKDLELLNNEKSFTISVKKHKRINLKFTV